MPVTATLHRVNTALARFVHTEAFVAAARNEEKKKQTDGVSDSTAQQENFYS